MIVSAYTLDLYCENEHPYETPGYRTYEAQFVVDGPKCYKDARKKARDAGWKLTHDRKAYCPACSGITPKPVKEPQGKVVSVFELVEKARAEAGAKKHDRNPHAGRDLINNPLTPEEFAAHYPDYCNPGTFRPFGPQTMTTEFGRVMHLIVEKERTSNSRYKAKCGLTNTFLGQNFHHGQYCPKCFPDHRKK